MSAKVLDAQGRWRNVTVAFRISSEEDATIKRLVKLSGLTKQDYVIKRLQDDKVIARGNPKVYKALRGELAKVLDELKRIDAG